MTGDRRPTEEWVGSPGEYGAALEPDWSDVGRAIGELLGRLVVGAMRVAVLAAAIKYLMSN